MVVRCPQCSSINVDFVNEGNNAGNYLCQDCYFIGEAILEDDEFDEEDIEKDYNEDLSDNEF